MLYSLKNSSCHTVFIWSCLKGEPPSSHLRLPLWVLTSTALQCGHLIRTSPLLSSFPSSSLSSSSSTTELCMTLLQGPLLSSAEGTDSLFSISRLSYSWQDDDKVLRVHVCSVSVLKSVTNENLKKHFLSRHWINQELKLHFKNGCIQMFGSREYSFYILFWCKVIFQSTNKLSRNTLKYCDFW